MKNLFSLLERFSKILNKDASTKEAISQVIQNKIGVALPPDKFLLKDGVLEITSSPVIKNEISLKEGSIKDELKEVHRISVSRILYK